MSEHLYLIHYSSDIGLKGKNRGDFIKQLKRNLRRQLPLQQVREVRGRLLAWGPRPDLNLARVFGVAWWAVPRQVPPRWEAIVEAGVALAREAMARCEVRTFAVRARRADKSFPKGTLAIERELGAAIVQATGLGVNLTRPDLTVRVEIIPGQAFVFTDAHQGFQGLPVGTAGKVLGLFSGGVDSLIAAWLMARRGAAVELVHFHAFTAARYAHHDKAGRLAQALAAYIPGLRVHYVPYHLFQAATLDLPRREARYELVVFRRFMARLAARLARQRGAAAIFTGDSLAQVASQTMENLTAVDAGVDFPLFRPLIAFNKQEIIAWAERLKFYDLAKQPYKDCCSIISRNPATRARLEVVEAIEQRAGLDAVLEASLAEVETIAYPAADLPAWED